MSQVKVSGIIVSMVAVMFAGFSANAAATDVFIHAESPVSEVVNGSGDIKFDWKNPGLVQVYYSLVTSDGDVDDWSVHTDYTWANFPYGYGWWFVVNEALIPPLFLPIGPNSTSATQFHHKFPDDSPDEFIYTTKFNENGHLKYFELKKDYSIDLSEKFDKEYMPEEYATDLIAGIYKQWLKDRSHDPSLDWDFINFDTGVMTIKQGYRWDGASYPCKDFQLPNLVPRCIDDFYNIRSSLVHDALYDLMRMQYMEWDPTEPTDLPDIADELLEFIKVGPIGDRCSDNGVQGSNDQGLSNREMADLLLYMIAVEEGQIEEWGGDVFPFYPPIFPLYPFWVMTESDGAVVSYRSAWIDLKLMRQPAVAPATCDEERLPYWKYHVSELTATGSDGKVDLTWKPANDAGRDPLSDEPRYSPDSEYTILRREIHHIQFTKLTESHPETTPSYTDHTAVDGKTYRYRVIRSGTPKYDDYSNSAEATVINIAPTVDAGNDVTIDEGDNFTRWGSFIDPGDDTWTATVDYGDGLGVQPLPLIGKTFDLSHVYADNGVYTVTVTVTDNDGGVGTDAAQLTVDNVAPLVSIDSVVQPNPHFILPVVHTLTFNGSFSDPGWLDTHNSNWDFDDGTDVAGTLTEENVPPDSTGDSTSQHAYSATGVYNVILGIMDNDGGIGTGNREVTVISPQDAIVVLNQYIQGLPGNAFNNNPVQRKNAFLNKLGEVLDLIHAGAYPEAINKLQNDIRAKADANAGGNSKNDWIRSPEAQQQICSMIDDLTAYLETM